MGSEKPRIRPSVSAATSLALFSAIGQSRADLVASSKAGQNWPQWHNISSTLLRVCKSRPPRVIGSRYQHYLWTMRTLGRSPLVNRIPGGSVYPRAGVELTKVALQHPEVCSWLPASGSTCSCVLHHRIGRQLRCRKRTGRRPIIVIHTISRLTVLIPLPYHLIRRSRSTSTDLRLLLIILTRRRHTRKRNRLHLPIPTSPNPQRNQ